jgi:hypothetical protein
MSTLAHGWFRARNSIISVHGGYPDSKAPPL